MVDNVFFTAEEVFLFWCCIKNLQCTSARFFVRAQPTFCFGRNWHIPIYSARKTLTHLGKKIFANRLHAYFIHGLNRKLNSRQRSSNSPDWYFSADIAQFLFKNARWQIMFFFTLEEVFLYWCCIKNVQYRSARSFCASSTDVLFWPKLACSDLFGQENISPSQQKNITHRYWPKKMTVDVGQERWPMEV